MKDLTLEQFYDQFVDVDELQSLYEKSHALGMRDRSTLDSVIESAGVAMVAAEAVTLEYRDLGKSHFKKMLKEFQDTLPDKLSTR